MIVNCPSCGTRYRHRSALGGESPHARCSSCEHVFPLVQGARSYLVMASAGEGVLVGAGRPRAAAGVGTRGGLAIGMDDPSIAAQLEKTALTGGGATGQAITYRVDLDVEDSPAAGEQVEVEHEALAEGPRQAGPMTVLFALATAAAGSWSGWWFAPRLPGQPETWILAGAGMGLIVAWLGLRWTQTRS